MNEELAEKGGKGNKKTLPQRIGEGNNHQQSTNSQKAVCIVEKDTLVKQCQDEAKERQREAGQLFGKGYPKVPQTFGEANNKHANETPQPITWFF